MTRQPEGFPPPAANSSRADAEGAARALVAELERDRSLDQAAQLRRRVDAAERLEAYLLDAQRCTDGANDQEGAALRQRARAIQSRLQAADSRLFASIRSEVRQGRGGLRLAEWCAGESDPATTPVRPRGHAYDHLDVLVAGVLRFDTPAEIPGLPPEMVAYQPTPARHIFDLLSRVSLTPDDVLVDLGSGLGHVPLLAAICTSARSVGVELQQAYVDVARRSASALGLAAATFEEQDARLADLSAGTVFYLYTPFTGAVLRSVLNSLRREAAVRDIRVCTLGPCTDVVGNESWLEPDEALVDDRVVVFSSRRTSGSGPCRAISGLEPTP